MKPKDFLTATALQRIKFGMYGGETQGAKARIAVLLGRWVKHGHGPVSTSDAEKIRLAKEKRFSNVTLVQKNAWSTVGYRKARLDMEVVEEMLGRIRKVAGLPPGGVEV